MKIVNRILGSVSGTIPTHAENDEMVNFTIQRKRGGALAAQMKGSDWIAFLLRATNTNELGSGELRSLTVMFCGYKTEGDNTIYVVRSVRAVKSAVVMDTETDVTRAEELSAQEQTSEEVLEKVKGRTNQITHNYLGLMGGLREYSGKHGSFARLYINRVKKNGKHEGIAAKISGKALVKFKDRLMAGEFTDKQIDFAGFYQTETYQGNERKVFVVLWTDVAATAEEKAARRNAYFARLRKEKAPSDLPSCF